MDIKKSPVGAETHIKKACNRNRRQGILHRPSTLFLRRNVTPFSHEPVPKLLTNWNNLYNQTSIILTAAYSALLKKTVQRRLQDMIFLFNTG